MIRQTFSSSFLMQNQDLFPNEFQESSIDEPQDKECKLCQDIDIIRCMMISVTSKHNETPNFYLGLVQKLTEQPKNRSILTIKFDEILKNCHHEDTIKSYLDRKVQRVQIKEMLQYYKYRKFVPLFADLKLGKMLHGYYYQRLKLYYNQIKIKLNLSVDPSSSSQITFSSDLSGTKTLHKSKILEEMSGHFKMEETTGPTLHNYKTESKALEDLVNFLKSNEKFDKITPLNVQCEWEKMKKTSQQIFRDILGEKKQQNFKKNSKSKVFITFYSRDGSLKKDNTGKKNQLKVLRSEKLIKSKDLRDLNKEKEFKMMQKLEKMKNEILNQKLLQLNRQGDKAKHKTTNEKPISGRATPIKFQQSSNAFTKRKSLKKLVFSSRNQVLHNSPQNEITIQQANPRVKKVQSQPKLPKKSTSLQKPKASKPILHKPLFQLISNQHLPVHECPQKQPIIVSTLSNRPISRRKSLDLTKMKSLLQQFHQSKQKKDDYMTHRYQNLIIDTPNKYQIRTANVSPVARRTRGEVEQIVLEKSDNIVSMKKKKLDALKKRVEGQKGRKLLE